MDLIGFSNNLIAFDKFKANSVSINFYETDINETKKYHWGENYLTLIKIDNDWLIGKTDSWKFD